MASPTITGQYLPVGIQQELDMLRERDPAYSVVGAANGGYCVCLELRGGPIVTIAGVRDSWDTMRLLQALRKAPPSDELRALRLWHWRKTLKLRAKANDLTTSDHAAARYNSKADFHIKQVQALNELFPLGDNVEGDNATPNPGVN